MYCKHCGHELDENNKCTNPECPSNLNKDTTNSNHDNIFEHNIEESNTEEQNTHQEYSSDYNNYNPGVFNDNGEITMPELIAFVGEQKADYYLEKWEAYKDNPNFISWNWASFLCGFYWFWYRKMYSIFLILIVVDFLGALVLPSGAASILSLGVTIGCGLFGNQLYMKHANKRIRSIKSIYSNRGLDYETVMRKLRVDGGITIVPAIVGGVMAVLTVIFIVLIIVGAVLIDPSQISLY